MVEVVSLLRDQIKVKGPKTIKAFKSTVCDDFIKVPEVFHEEMTEADLIIMVDIIYEYSSFLAYASPCHINEDDGRPDIGMIRINKRNIKMRGKTLRELSRIILHESLHILVFSPLLYDKFENDSKVIQKDSSNN